MNTELEKLIGQHMDSKQAQSADWAGYWPEVDSDGIITAILDGDCIPEDAVMINGFNPDGSPIITDGDYGFEAILVS